MLVITTASNAVLLVANLAAGIVIARALGVADRGALGAAIAVALLVSRAGVVGLDVGLAALARGEGRLRRADAARALLIAAALGTSALAAAGLMLAPPALGWSAAAWLWVFMVCGQVAEIASTSLVARGAFAPFNLGRIAYAAVLAGGSLGTAAAGLLDLGTALAVFAAAAVANAAVALAGLLRLASAGGPSPLRRLLAPALPVAPFASARAAEAYLPQLALAAAGDLPGLGLFVVAHAVASTQLVWADALGRVLFAQANRTDEGDGRAAKARLLASLRLNLASCAVVGCAVAALGYVAIPLVYGREFAAASAVCLLWAPVVAAVGCNNALEEALKATPWRGRLLPHKLAQLGAFAAVFALAGPPTAGLAGTTAVALAGLAGVAVALALNARLLAGRVLEAPPRALLPSPADLAAGLRRLALAARPPWPRPRRRRPAEQPS